MAIMNRTTGETLNTIADINIAGKTIRY